MNRPPVNALVAELQEELVEALKRLKDDDATRVVGLTGAIDRYSMAEAAAIGLINAAVPQAGFHEAVLERARRLAKAAPIALRLAKEALLAGLERAPGKGYEVEAENFGRAAMTEDAMVGIMSFVQKQQPDFKGK